MRRAGWAGAGAATAGAATAGAGAADGAGGVWAWTPAVKSTMMDAATIVVAARMRFIMVAFSDVNSRLKVLPAARKLNAKGARRPCHP
jgi:hypothetical protein